MRSVFAVVVVALVSLLDPSFGLTIEEQLKGAMNKRILFYGNDPSRLVRLVGEHKEPDHRDLDYFRGALGDWSNAKKPETVATTMDEQIVGPAMDYTNKSFYFVHRACPSSGSAQTRRILAARKRVKSLLPERPVPSGAVVSGVCANNTYVYALSRYHWDTETFDLLYSTSVTEFPAPGASIDKTTWKLAFDSKSKMLYWTVHKGFRIILGQASRVLMDVVSLDIGAIDRSGEQAEPSDVKVAFSLNDVRPERYINLEADSNGTLWFADWYSIRKWRNNTAGVVHVLPEPAVLNTSTPSHLLHPNPMKDPTGARLDTDTAVAVPFCMSPAIAPTCAVQSFAIDESSPGGPFIWYTFMGSTAAFTFQIRRMTVDGLRHEIVYSKAYYEFPTGALGAGMTLYNLALDLVHRHLYVTMAGGNTVARSIMRLDMDVPLGSVACLWGHSSYCQYRGLGETMEVGNEGGASSAYGMGQGMSSNWAPGDVSRTIAFGTGVTGVVPSRARNMSACERMGAGSPQLNGNAMRTNIAAVQRTCSNTVPALSPQRRIFFRDDAGLPKQFAHNLMELVGDGNLAWCGFGSNCYGKFIGNHLATQEQMRIVDSGGGVPFGKSPGQYAVEKQRGHTIAGPTLDHKRDLIYWIRCDAMLLSGMCMRYALVRRPVNVSSVAAATDVQVLYVQDVQLFPGPTIFTPQTLQLAVDSDANVVYWISADTPRSASAYLHAVNVLRLELPGARPLAPCEVPTLLALDQLGSWRSLEVGCDGNLYTSTLQEIVRIDPGTLAKTTLVTAPQMQGTACTPNIFSCAIKTMTLDSSTQRIIFAFDRSGYRHEIWWMRFNGSDLTMLYEGFNYERAKLWGGQFMSGFGVDAASRLLYVESYHGNSAKRSIVHLPLPGSPYFPGFGTFGCLYGHKSIPHASLGNRDCTYQGPDTEYDFTGFAVPVPVNGADRVLSTGGPIVIIPSNYSHPIRGKFNLDDWFAPAVRGVPGNGHGSQNEYRDQFTIIRIQSGTHRMTTSYYRPDLTVIGDYVSDNFGADLCVNADFGGDRCNAFLIDKPASSNSAPTYYFYSQAVPPIRSATTGSWAQASFYRRVRFKDGERAGIQEDPCERAQCGEGFCYNVTATDNGLARRSAGVGAALGTQCLCDAGFTEDSNGRCTGAKPDQLAFAATESGAVQTEALPSCSNGIKDGDELDVDVLPGRCGGGLEGQMCSPASAPPGLQQGAYNASQTGCGQCVSGLACIATPHSAQGGRCLRELLDEFVYVTIHNLTIRGISVRQFYSGGLAALQQALGATTKSLDPVGVAAGGSLATPGTSNPREGSSDLRGPAGFVIPRRVAPLNSSSSLPAAAAQGIVVDIAVRSSQFDAINFGRTYESGTKAELDAALAFDSGRGLEAGIFTVAPSMNGKLSLDTTAATTKVEDSINVTRWFIETQGSVSSGTSISVDGSPRYSVSTIATADREKECARLCMRHSECSVFWVTSFYCYRRSGSFSVSSSGSTSIFVMRSATQAAQLVSNSGGNGNQLSVPRLDVSASSQCAITPLGQCAVTRCGDGLCVPATAPAAAAAIRMAGAGASIRSLRRRGDQDSVSAPQDSPEAVCICSPGFVADDAGSCTRLATESSCSDGLVGISSNETDIDAGNECGPVPLGAQCVRPKLATNGTVLTEFVRAMCETGSRCNHTTRMCERDPPTLPLPAGTIVVSLTGIRLMGISLPVMRSSAVQTAMIRGAARSVGTVLGGSGSVSGSEVKGFVVRSVDPLFVDGVPNASNPSRGPGAKIMAGLAQDFDLGLLVSSESIIDIVLEIPPGSQGASQSSAAMQSAARSFFATPRRGRSMQSSMTTPQWLQDEVPTLGSASRVSVALEGDVTVTTSTSAVAASTSPVPASPSASTSAVAASPSASASSSSGSPPSSTSTPSPTKAASASASSSSGSPPSSTSTPSPTKAASASATPACPASCGQGLCVTGGCVCFPGYLTGAQGSCSVTRDASSAATCSDFLSNGAETDVDCGGSTCTACGQGQSCTASSDCAGTDLICRKRSSDAANSRCLRRVQSQGTFVAVSGVKLTDICAGQLTPTLKAQLISRMRSSVSGAQSVAIEGITDFGTCLPASRRLLARELQATRGVNLDFSVQLPSSTSETAAQATVQSYMQGASTSPGSFGADVSAALGSGSSVTVDAAQAQLSASTVQQAVTFTEPSPAASASPSAASPPGPPLGAIIGGAAGAVVVVGLLLAAWCCCIRPRNAASKRKAMQATVSATGTTNSVHVASRTSAKVAQEV